MSTITTINANDQITDSRAVINTNFSNLNTDKIETAVLDTDTSLAANSDAKIATQKATKGYVDSQVGQAASETVKGVVEEASTSEVTAGTNTGGTGAKLFVPPGKLNTQIDTKIAAAAGLQQLGETILSGVATTIDVPVIATRKDLRIVVRLPGGTSGQSIVGLQFNGDTGNNYGRTSILLDGAIAANMANAGSSIDLAAEAGDLDSQEFFSVIDVINDAAGAIKLGKFHSVVADATDTNAPTEVIIGAFQWSNTSEQIDQVTVVSGGVNMPVGSRVTVYGKKD